MPSGPVDGIARKVSLFSVFLSLIGWLIFTVFFGFTINRYSNRIDILFLPHWCFMVTGVFLHANLIISLTINGRWYTDTTIHLFNALYLSAGGATFYTDWTLYYSLYFQDVRYLFELGGCALSGICLTFSIMMWPFFTHVRVGNASVADADPEVANLVHQPNSQPPLAMVNLSATVDIRGMNAENIDEKEEDEYASLTDMKDGTTDYKKQDLRSSTNPEGDEEYDSVDSVRVEAHYHAQDERNYVGNKLDSQDEGDYVVNELDAQDEGGYVINELDAQDEGGYVINKLDSQEGEYAEVSLVVHEQNDQ